MIRPPQRSTLSPYTTLFRSELNDRHGHIQEIIVQNFRPKPGTRMARHPAPSLEEHLWTIAVARLLFEPSMNIQDRKSTRLNSSHSQISYAVFCLKKKKHRTP